MTVQKEGAMTGRKRFWLTPVLALVTACGAAHGSRMPLPIEYDVLKSDLIVEAQETDEAGTVSVERVFLGPARPGDRLVVARLDRVPREVRDPASRGRRSRTRRLKEGKALLFLVRAKDGPGWELFDRIFGVRWIAGDTVYVWFPITRTPGPYAFQPAGTIDELRQAVALGIEKRARFEAALRNPDPEQKVEALAQFVQPFGGGYYAAEALGEMAKLGGPAAKMLCALAEDKGDAGTLRLEIIRAIGKCEDRGAVPYLLDVVAKAQAGFVKTGRGFDALNTTPQDHSAHAEWRAALGALARIADERSLPAFRRALAWAARTDASGMAHTACAGLGRMPSRENLAVLAEMACAARRNEASQLSTSAARPLIHALAQHNFPQTVPVLAMLLDHPEEITKEKARYALTGIVGKNLGPRGVPWLEWYRKEAKKETQKEKTPPGGDE